MHTITLGVSKQGVEGSRESIELSFSDAALSVMRKYLQNCERLRTAKLCKTGLPTLKKIGYGTTGFVLETTDFEYSELCELLHLARPLLLFREPASFAKTAALLSKACSNEMFQQHIHAARRIYETGDYGRYFQLTINNVPLFSDKAARLWLNGVEYHQDADKAAVIAEIERSLSEGNMRWLFAAHLGGRVLAIHMLEDTVAKIVAGADRKTSDADDNVIGHETEMDVCQ